MSLEEETGLKGRFGTTRFIDQGSDGSSKIFCNSGEGGDEPIAIKVINLDLRLEEAIHEVCILKSLQSPHVLPILSTYIHANFLYMVIPLNSFLSVKKLFHNEYEEGLPEVVVSQILKDTIRGVEYLHRCNLVHRSLKSSHLLINSQGRVVLSGLRHSVRVERSKQCHAFPTEHALYNLCLLAPEILAQNLQGYHLKSDVYSLGILALELANGKPPFVNYAAPSVLYFKLTDVVPTLIAKSFKQSFFDFTNRCLEYDPQLRPSCHQLLRHPFIKQNKKCNSLWKHIRPPEAQQEAEQVAARDRTNPTFVNGTRNCDITSGENGNEGGSGFVEEYELPVWSFELEDQPV